MAGPSTLPIFLEPINSDLLLLLSSFFLSPIFHTQQQQDRIYCTCCQAYSLKMGCAPAGPAGTGKTETTKDLAFALAVCIYVFNCAPEMDYISMGNIFKGLSASGSWGCFDEFNRLRLEVLSVCTVQYKAVLDALRSMIGNETVSVTVNGDTVKCKRTVMSIITMNPGYAGRATLPEGLKALVGSFSFFFFEKESLPSHSCCV